jgi:hypothetical protein
VLELIAASTRHFEAGQKELQDGHLETAKALFNRSLDVLRWLVRVLTLQVTRQDGRGHHLHAGRCGAVHPGGCRAISERPHPTRQRKRT